MKKIFFFSFLLLTFLCIAIICIYFAVEDEIYAFIVPLIVSGIGVITISYILIVETIVGHKVYYYDNELLYIKRKNKTIIKIEKRTIENVTLVFDVNADNLYIVSFEHRDKKHYLPVNSYNIEAIWKFVEGIDYNIKNTYWYYLIYLMEILLI